MIQAEEIGNKIKQLIIDKDLTSTKFADEIGVPRPSISHILSGRNKPSLEIVLKIIQRYPELRSIWFSDDIEFTSENTAYSVENKQVKSEIRPISDSRELNNRNFVHQSTEFFNQKASNSMLTTLPIDQNKQIEHIVVFYTDKTFTHFKPNE